MSKLLCVLVILMLVVGTEQKPSRAEFVGFITECTNCCNTSSLVDPPEKGACKGWCSALAALCNTKDKFADCRKLEKDDIGRDVCWNVVYIEEIKSIKELIRNARNGI